MSDYKHWNDARMRFIFPRGTDLKPLDGDSTEFFAGFYQYRQNELLLETFDPAWPRNNEQFAHFLFPLTFTCPCSCARLSKYAIFPTSYNPNLSALGNLTQSLNDDYPHLIG